MSSGEDWRRRRADELFGTDPTPWFIKAARTAPAPTDDAVLPIAKDAGDSLQPPNKLHPPPAGTRQRALTERPITVLRRPAVDKPGRTQFRRRSTFPWLPLVALVALIVAGAVGWLARTYLDPQGSWPAVATSPVPVPTPPVVGPPLAAPRVVTPSPVLVAQPSTLIAPDGSEPVASPVEPKTISRHVPLRARPAPRHAKHARTAPTTRLKPRSAPAAKMAPAKAAAVLASKPSFDCRHSHGDIARSICRDRQLATLDRRLATRFAALDRSVDAATVQRIHHGQTSFLNRRQNCASRACLVALYRGRLHELRNVGQ